MKPSTLARRALLATLLAGTTTVATGCSSGGFSMASLNPFSSKPTTGVGSSPTITESIAATTDGARGQFSKIGSSAKNAWGKTSDTVGGLFARGSGAGSDEEVSSAPDPLRLDGKPDHISPEVFVANGQLWESTGDFNKAMESYVKALEQEPNHPPALTSIARLHFRKGEHQKAAEFFQKAIEQSPEDAGLYNDLGLTLSKLGQHDLATQSLQRALQLAPGTSRYANNLASIQFEAGQSQDAYQVLQDNNKPAVAHFNMAYLHFKKGQMNEARGHLNQAMEFEQQAEKDAAVKRAVDRSRDMLAQINGSLSPIAQAAPQATIAGLPTGREVQQASQSQAAPTSGGVAPASQVAPAAPPAAMTWQGGSTTPATPTVPAATSGPAKTAAPAWNPPTTRLPAAHPATSTPATSAPATSAPIWGAPTPPTSGSSTPGSSTPAAATSSPSGPFALPTGFGGTPSTP